MGWLEFGTQTALEYLRRFLYPALLTAISIRRNLDPCLLIVGSSKSHITRVTVLWKLAYSKTLSRTAGICYVQIDRCFVTTECRRSPVRLRDSDPGKRLSCFSTKIIARYNFWRQRQFSKAIRSNILRGGNVITKVRLPKRSLELFFASQSRRKAWLAEVDRSV